MKREKIKVTEKVKEMVREKPSDSITTFLGTTATFEGLLRFDGTTMVDGNVNGTIKSDAGTLIVGERARVEADIFVKVAVVRGRVKGKIQAVDRIEVYAPADIEGDIQAPVISIDAGVKFNGNCLMSKPAAVKAEAEAKAEVDAES